MLSNGATADVVGQSLDFHFQGHELCNVYISKTLRTSEKCSEMNFIKVAILPSNGTIANIVLHDIDLNYQGETFQVAILTSKRWKNANVTIVIR